MKAIKRKKYVVDAQQKIVKMHFKMCIVVGPKKKIFY